MNDSFPPKDRKPTKVASGNDKELMKEAEQRIKELQIPISDLFDCSCCHYTKEKYNQNQKKWDSWANHWDSYKPIVYKSKLLRQWVVECQNCAMTIIFHESDIDIVIKKWNSLSKVINDH